MNKIKTTIIPINPNFYQLETKKELDLKAICFFIATGFFLDTDTYWKNKKVLKPAHIHTFENNQLIHSEPYFKWHYSPRDITFEQALEEFTDLFEKIIQEHTKDKKVILPLSGGLDSRTQAAALRNHPSIHSYSYAFKNGYPEYKIGREIAKILKFPFQQFEVSEGYLWDKIDELADINQCYSEFTHPRQMAFIDAYKSMGTIFSLGHWGDVLFDSMNLPQLSLEEEVDILLKKIIKKGGLELANQMWSAWGLDGDFSSYIKSRVKKLLLGIDIENTNAKLRAFKSLYWAPRWTSVNLSIFENETPISLPYYDNRMCEFICSVPEEYLANRKLQIAYIKSSAPKLADITWQEQKPFHLNNYHLNKSPYNFPYKVTNKVLREIRKLIGKPHISRNWELQFLGIENDIELKKWLFDSGLEKLIEPSITEYIYNSFKTIDAVKYSHPVSMILTLALFNQKFNR